VSWYEFAVEIMNYAKLSCKVHPISTENYPMPAARPAYSVLDTSKIRKTFGVEIPNWKDSLHRCIDRLLI
jgi:dTDP-4-dehydrorhamnose reductase